MNENLNLHEFEEKIRLAYSAEPMRLEFAYRMQSVLAANAEEIKRVQTSPNRWKLSWTFSLVLLSFLIIIILVMSPQKVLASLQKLFGYIPGVGIVEQGTSIRLLSEPVIDTQADIQWTISEGYFTLEKSIIVYSIENVPFSVLSHDENIVGCTEFPTIVLPDGTRLSATGSWGNSIESHISYPSIPKNVDEITLELPCIQNSLPGLAPENWGVSLKIVSAPPDFIAIPVIEVNHSEIPVTNPVTEQVKTTQAEGLFGIKVVIDQAIPIPDGYYLIGHNEWEDERIITAWPSGYALQATDANGISIPIEPAYFSNIGIQDPQEGQWFYKTYGRGFSPPLTIVVEMMTIDFQPATNLEIDPDQLGFDPLSISPDTNLNFAPIEFEIMGYKASVVQATYMTQGIFKGFDFGIEADPAIYSIPFNLNSPVIGGSGASGGGSGFDKRSGLVSSIVLQDGSMQYPLQIKINSLSVKGDWKVEWNAPVENDQKLVVFEECFSLSDWDNMQKNPPAIPQELTGRILFGRAPLGPNPSEFLASLDGSQEQALSPGRNSVSPDGTSLVYSNQNGQIIILNLLDQTEFVVTEGFLDSSPIWSPNGKHIAFTRSSEETQIYVTNADGSNLTEISQSDRFPSLLGWTADSRQVMYRNQKGERTQPIIMVDIEMHVETLLFDILSTAAISPDGKWIAYIDLVPGKMGPGLYLSRLDQSEKRLLVQLGHIYFSGITWSPDGKWIGFSIQDNATYIPTSGAAIINPESCQVYPINIDGIEILKEWRNP